VERHCTCILFENKIFFHPAKFDNFKDETISEYKTVSVPQSKILAGLKNLGLLGLFATFDKFFFCLGGQKKKKKKNLKYFIKPH
jgi:hypothetical protein